MEPRSVSRIKGNSRIRIKNKCRELWKANNGDMEALLEPRCLTVGPWRVHFRPVGTDSHYFDELADPDPDLHLYQSEKFCPIPHQSENPDQDPHQSENLIRIRNTDYVAVR